MKTLLKWAIWLAVAVIVVFLGGGYVLPGEAVVQRQTVIAAPPEKVFAVIGNLKRFNEWSPWAELDPNIQYKFEGPEMGVGQKMSWTSNNPDVGNGSQTITAYEQNKRIAAALDFGAMGKAVASMELAPAGGGTAVTWGFKTELKGALERWFGLMFDRWVGADYERGLARLKALAEKEAAGG
ncbi:MAG: SRPBCC family protein [Hyphomicrobiales bacterium]